MAESIERRRRSGKSWKRRGFVLQSTYRIESGRPVVHVWGKLESGESFLIRDRRPVPHFYVRAEDAGRAARCGAAAIVATELETLAGEPVARVEVLTPPDTVPVRKQLQQAGVTVYEADVRYGIRYLIDHGIKGSLALGGESSRQGSGPRIFEDPEIIEPADWTPELSVLSLDIETDPRGRQVLSVALHGCGAAEVLLLEPQGYTSPPGAVALPSEAALLARLAERVRQLDPDVVTGWNVADFDFAVLRRRAEKLGVRFELGRGRGRVRILAGRSPRQATQVVIPGRVVMDGLALVRGAFLQFESYSLEFVSQAVLGEGKLIRGRHRAQEILRCFHEDRQRLVDYNLTDARLVTDLVARLELVELAVARSRLTGLPPDRVSASIAAFDFLYLSELGRRGIVAPSVRSREDSTPMGGGHVLTPDPGLYDNVVVLDFKSLYPSLIRTFQIDPLGYARSGESADPIMAPNGAAFRRQPGILTALLDKLFPRREAAKRAGDHVASFAIKILMNSFFGVLGTSVCRFYSPPVANAITSFGRELLVWSKERIESYGQRVLYGDTDSLFVESGLAEAEPARALGGELAERLNADLATHVRRRWRVESRMELEFERLYLRLFLQPLRGATRGATKRYAGLVEEDGQATVVLTGLEAVRRDWTALARRMQRELYERFLLDRPVEDYLRDLVARVRAGRHDRELVYRKTLRKDLRDYTSTTPPHVAAARKMSGKPGRRISYVITEAGPEPAGEIAHRLDYEHYVDKQIRPIAEPVLATLGLEFKKVIGDETQMGLFD